MCLEATTQAASRPADHGISRRRFLLGAGAAALATTLPAPALAGNGTRTRGLQDLTHVFREGFPVYGGNPPERRTLVTIENDGFYQQEWTFAEHSATHMDAPGHFIQGGRLSPEITLPELFVRVAVIDISDRAASNPDAEVTVADLQEFEAAHGRIPPNAGVFMYSGWETRAGDPEAYRNPGPDGLFHFPGWSLEAVEWLLENRRITSIGVDTLSLDPGNSQTFAVHHRLLGADRYGLENLANLSTIPPKGATGIVGLIPWEEGSGGPARVIARW